MATKAIQGKMDTLMVERGTPGIYNTGALVAAINAAGVIGVEFVCWEMTVPAQQKIRWGYGTPQLPMNQGYCFWCSMNDTVDYDIGVLSLCAQNASRTDTRYIKKMDDMNLHLIGATPTMVESVLFDRNQMIALPEMGILVGKDSRLQLRYNIQVNATATDIVQFSLPITQYMV